jgi:hypothetical protein
MPKPAETGLLTSANKRKAGGRDSSMLLCFRENLPWHRLSAPGTMKGRLMGLLTVHWTQPSSYRHQGSGREGDHRWSNENEIEVHYVSPLTCLWLSSRVLHSVLGLIVQLSLPSFLFLRSPLKDTDQFSVLFMVRYDPYWHYFVKIYIRNVLQVISLLVI